MGIDPPLFHIAGTPPARLRIARPLGVLSGGSHHPLVCAMERGDRPAGSWVVKQQVVLSTSSGYGAFSTVAELAGAEVCTWAGLAAPAIGLASFPQAFDEAELRSSIAALDEPTRGEIVEIYDANRGLLAFCARLVTPSSDLVPEAFARTARHREGLAADGAALFVADAFMLHADREATNPNALRYRKQTVAIDHNLAFAALARAGESGASAALVTRPPAAFKRHVAGSVIGRDVDDPHLDAALARLEAVTDAQIDALIASWPPELDNEVSHSISRIFDRFRTFLRARRKHVRAFVAEACAMLHSPS